MGCPVLLNWRTPETYVADTIIVKYPVFVPNRLGDFFRNGFIEQYVSPVGMTFPVLDHEILIRLWLQNTPGWYSMTPVFYPAKCKKLKTFPASVRTLP
jgi:hypothetical protein